MPASLHLARYPAAAAARMLVGMARRRGELRSAYRLTAARLFATVESSPAVSGMPTPRRWALLCVWEEDDDVVASVEASPILQTFERDAREVWRVMLEPVRVVRGSWRGWRPSTERAEPFASEEPMAVMTYGRLRWRYVPSFLRANRRAIAHARRQPGLIDDVGLSDGIRVASTFSIWRSEEDATRFAYGPGDHVPIARRSLGRPWADDYFFARFRLLASSGSWDGRDPAQQALGLEHGRDVPAVPAQVA